MYLLDVRTVMITYIITNAINAGVIFMLWRQNRMRFAGIGLWLADYILQFAAMLLITFRGAIPEAIPVILGNGMVIGGTILLYIGLERFVERRGQQIQNAILLAAFLGVQAYFYQVYNSLDVRNLNISFALILISVQCVWLMFRRAEPEMRPFTRNIGSVFAGYCIVSFLRIVADIAVPSGNDFFHSDIYDTLVLLTYQMLFIILTFNLFLMVNRRLFGDLDRDRAIRKAVEEELRISEEKFSKAFHSSPDAILITRARDGKLVDVNDGFCRMMGYTREEALLSSTVHLALWAIPQDREKFVNALMAGDHIHNLELDCRTKSGSLLHCLISGEMIQLAGETHIVSIVRDITERKQSEEILRRSEANFREVFENSAQGIFIIDVLENGKFMIHDSNPAQAKISGFHHQESRGKMLEEAFPEETAQVLRANFKLCLEAGGPIAVEEDVDLPAGRKNMHTMLAPVRDDSGRVYRIIGSTLDISERKRIENILRLRLNLWEFAGSHTVDELMQKTLDEIENITSSPISFYHFVMDDQKSLSLHAWSTRTMREFCTAEGRGMHYDLDQAGVWADAVRERKPVCHNDYATLPSRKGLPPGHAQIIRELVVPTLRAGRVVSALGVGNKPTDYDEKDAELLSYIADIVWVIIERKRTEEEIRNLQEQLRDLAIHDSLTGLYNRHYLDETLKRELARAAREKYPVSFIMIDIDNFKRVNDAFGHKAGDAVLRDLAVHLMNSSRASDIIYRYGGEEFLAVLPKAKAEFALQIAEKWRGQFQKSTVLLEFGGVKTTISCGIASFPKHGTSVPDLIANADQAMYQAKSGGRNRSEVWKKAAKKSRRQE